ncbi:MAG TPA: hypothetical protein VGH20_16365 [Myxococcales bacterium]|jgi:hypothetical protein
MKEALKLFGAMLAIVVSVSALHRLQPTPDSSWGCQPQFCSDNIPCECGTCVGGICQF